MALSLKAALLLAAAAAAAVALSHSQQQSRFFCSAFSVPPRPASSTTSTTSAAASVVCDQSRSAFLKTAAAGFVSSAVLSITAPSPASAKDVVDPSALKGTKSDPKYQACLSQCLYDCTKPKGDEQKSRAECIPECKGKCATSKEQLMIGTPKS